MNLLSTLSLNESPLSSSINTLKSSADGQIAVVTRGAIYIVTPDFNSELSRSESSSPELTFTWTKTAIHDLGKCRPWSEDSVQWRTISLGSLEPAWQAVAWSPSGFSKLGGCLLATLTNNMEVSIWTPVKNPLIGEWVKLQNVTEDQMTSFEEESSMSTQDVLRWQTCSIAWSESYWEDGLGPPNAVGGSLLALGSRSGDVNFLCLDSSENGVRQCLTHNVADTWVTRLVWSKWKPLNDAQPNQSVRAYLACGLSDGSLWVLTVEHNPNSEEQYLVSTSSMVANPDSRSITAMTFAEVGMDHQPVLAFSKPGLVGLYKLASVSEDRMVEDVSLQIVVLSVPRISIASTSVATCTGIYYVSLDDCLIAVLAEGSLNVIANVSGVAHLRDSSDVPNQITTSYLSKGLRRLMEIAEDNPLGQAEYARIHGLQFISAGNYVVWTQEVVRPYDLSFRVQAHSSTQICVAKLWDHNEDVNARVITAVRAALAGRKSILHFSPLVLLSEVMFELLDSSVIISVAPRLLPLLSPHWDPLVADCPDWSQGVDSGIDQQSFTHQTRLKLCIALFVLNRLGLPGDLVSLFKKVHEVLLEVSAALHIQSTVENILKKGDTSPLDHTSMLRFIHAAQYCPVPESVSHRFAQTKQKSHDYIQRHEPEQPPFNNQSNGMGGSQFVLEMSRGLDIDERCPACDSVVPFQNLAQGQCQAGHVWERCATSLQLITGIGSLTCTGCRRKALGGNPHALINSSTHCVLCGHRYFRVL